MSKAKAPRSRHEPDPASEGWRTLPWRKFEQHVYRIQKRIFRASQHGNIQAAHKLQKLLMKSRAARLLAVRRVTQENQGKNTAGVDGVKAVPPAQRLVLAEQIHPHRWKDSKPRLVRRVWIPKPGKTEKRPLGIPICAAHYPSFQTMFGIPWVLLLEDREFRSSITILLYHIRIALSRATVLPGPFHGLAQGRDDLRGERDPAWPQRSRAHALQPSGLAPVSNRRDIERSAILRRLWPNSDHLLADQ
jgi:hypothetical protein